ncbi:unnamed protein product [Sphagnum jensenii]|uniref:Uncharacterized protein n=1 Tax=Sphagnum jensenii TaxID=128206 RepID=A0ABP1APD7_9BRYO
MVKMNLHSEFEDLQIQKLNEFLLVSDRIRKAGRSTWKGLGKFKKPSPNGGGAPLPILTNNENTLCTNRSILLPPQSSREALPESSLVSSGTPLDRGEGSAIQAEGGPAARITQTECQFRIKSAQATSTRSDGGEHEGQQQRLPSQLPFQLISHDIPARARTSKAKATGAPPHTQVLTNHSLPLSRISEFPSVIVEQRPVTGNGSATAARQVSREDASEARALVSSEKNEARRTSIAPTKTPPTPNLTTHLGSGPGSSSPPGGGKPRSIASGPQFGDGSGVSRGDGARNAKQLRKESVAYGNRKDAGREGDIQNTP